MGKLLTSLSGQNLYLLYSQHLGWAQAWRRFSHSIDFVVKWALPGEGWLLRQLAGLWFEVTGCIFQQTQQTQPVSFIPLKARFFYFQPPLIWINLSSNLSIRGVNTDKQGGEVDAPAPSLAQGYCWVSAAYPTIGA